MFSKRWWIRTTERFVKAGVYSFITLVGTDTVGWATLDEVFIGRTVAITMILSFSGSVLTSKWTDDDSNPSAVE